MDKEEMIERFLEFLRGYNDKRNYVEELKKLLVLEGSNVLMIDYYDLLSYDSELADELKVHPDEVIDAANEAVSIILKEDLLEEEIKVRASFINYIKTLSPRQLNSSMAGTFVQIRGIVTAVAEGERTNGLKGFIRKAVFICKHCNEEVVVIQDPYTAGNIKKPDSCPVCGGKDFEFALDRSEVVDMREIFVQDPLEALANTGNASYVRVILFDELARMNINPGDEVLITGIVRSVSKKKNGKVLDWVLEANGVVKLTKDIEDIQISSEEAQAFEEFSKLPDFEQRFIASIAPSIVGMEIEKKVVSWALFSGEDFETPGGHVRKRAHILLFGDAGTGKSEIIKFAAEVAPKGVWVSGTHSSGVGLTAAIDSLDGKRVLRAGALVIGDRGVVALDELDKMKDDDHDKLLDALEHGKFPFNKGGFHTVLMARATVIAAANPPGGKFDLNTKTPLEELMRTFDQPLYSRFDVILPVFGKKDNLEAIARAILEKHEGKVRPPFDKEFLTKYIVYAKRKVKRVEIPDELKKLLLEYMVQLGSVSDLTATRLMEGMIRLIEARARMHLRSKATIQDFLEVRKVYNEMLKRLVLSEDEERWKEALNALGGIIWTEEEKEKVETLLQIIRFFEGEKGAHLDDIVEVAKAQGIEKEEVLKLLDEMERSGLIRQVGSKRFATKR
ncbi:AAA family ATPase [Pyrococcus kukulkanii]|uniref:AAA family ATPase n=1 Tax=Pyrococcus kukulkanii TaxID=1609559 RepID=UPI003563B211